MLDDREGPKDWEIKDEDPPEGLRRKWDREEVAGSKTVICSSCKKETPAENLACVFCETPIFEGSCPFRCFFSWIRQLFRRF